jgi:hypothetical protein
VPLVLGQLPAPLLVLLLVPLLVPLLVWVRVPLVRGLVLLVPALLGLGVQVLSRPERFRAP